MKEVKDKGDKNRRTHDNGYESISEDDIIYAQKSISQNDRRTSELLTEIGVLQRINLENQIKALDGSNRVLDMELNRLYSEDKEKLRKINLDHQKTIEEQENQIKALDGSNRVLDMELNRLYSEDKEKLRKINLDHQKTIEEQENQIKALDGSNRVLDMELNRLYSEDKEKLRKINLDHQKTIEEQENQIKALDGSNRVLDMELNRLYSEDKEKLRKINLDHQKTIEEQENQIKALDGSNRVLDMELNRLYSEDKEKLRKINLDHQKTIEEQENQIKALDGSNRVLDMEQRRLDRTINSIHQSITWRTLTPVKKRYDRLVQKVNGRNRSRLSTSIKNSSPQVPTVDVLFATNAAAGAETFVQVKPKLEDKKDIVCFPLINWNFRYQRTQHLLSKFAENGHRVFHLKVDLMPEKSAYSITNIADNIFEIVLNCSSHFNVYKDILNKDTLESTLYSLEQMQRDLNIDALSFVAFPAWVPAVFALKREHGWPIIFDCLDEYYEFGNVNRERIEEELKIFKASDLVITTSAYLYKKAKKISNKTLCIPNAGEFDHFKNLPANDLLRDINKPIVGYYGAIAEWFDNETMEFIAIKRPNINFIFIGHTFGSNIAKLETLSNVRFLGEKPYSSLPSYLYHFDVCLIPFKMTSLIEATHPVKFYEYLASGKPVVSTKVPELIPFGNLCYLSSSKEEFLINLDKALIEDNHDLVKRRIEFSSKNTWQDRFDFLYSEVKKLRLT